MANDFYGPSGAPATRAAGSSAQIRNEFNLIQAGFDKMPALTGNQLQLVRVNAAGNALETVAVASAGFVLRAGDTMTGPLTAPGFTGPLTGNVTAGLGLVATPSIAFAGDANTGMWSPGADQIGWSVGGVQKLWLDANGRLGAGAAPGVQTQLEVLGSAAISGPSGAQYLLMGNRDSGGSNKPVVITAANGALTIGTGNSWASASGGVLSTNLVIDTGLFMYNRTVSTGVAPFQVAASVDIAPGSGNANLYIRSIAASNATLELSGNAVAAGSGLSVISDNTGIGYLYNRQNAALVFGTNNNTRLTLTAAGLCLINRTTDSGLGRLQVDGNVDFWASSGLSQMSLRATAGQAAFFEAAGNANTAGAASMLYGQDGSNNGYVYNRANASVFFGTNSTTRMTLSAAGALTPQTDSAQNLGAVANRWATVFTQNLSLGASSEVITSSSTTLQFGTGTGWTAQSFYTGGAQRVFIDASGHTYPAVAGTQTLGLSTNRWSNFYGVLGNFSGMITASGGVTGALTGNATTATALATARAINGVNFDGSAAISIPTLVNGANTLTLTSDGRLYGNALHNNAGSVTGTANQYVASGTYTPTGTNISNATGITINAFQWIRVGNVVSVSGSISAGATAAGTVSTIRLTLPIASNLTAIGQCAGSGWVGGTSPAAVNVEEDTTNDAAVLRFVPSQTGAASIYVHFQYVVA